MQAYREWLRERGLPQRDMARDQQRLRFVAHQQIAECALYMRIAHCAAVEAHVETVIGDTSRTIVACAARLAGIDRHPIARSHSLDHCAHGGDCSGDLVTKHHRLLETHGAKAAMPIVVQVRTADPARTDANQDVLRAKHRSFSVLFHPQVERRMNDETTHVRVLLTRGEPARYWHFCSPICSYCSSSQARALLEALPGVHAMPAKKI